MFLADFMYKDIICDRFFMKYEIPGLACLAKIGIFFGYFVDLSPKSADLFS